MHFEFAFVSKTYDCELHLQSMSCSFLPEKRGMSATFCCCEQYLKPFSQIWRHTKLDLPCLAKQFEATYGLEFMCRKLRFLRLLWKLAGISWHMKLFILHKQMGKNLVLESCKVFGSVCAFWMTSHLSIVKMCADHLHIASVLELFSECLQKLCAFSRRWYNSQV